MSLFISVFGFVCGLLCIKIIIVIIVSGRRCGGSRGFVYSSSRSDSSGLVFLTFFSLIKPFKFYHANTVLTGRDVLFICLVELSHHIRSNSTVFPWCTVSMRSYPVNEPLGFFLNGTFDVKISNDMLVNLLI